MDDDLAVEFENMIALVQASTSLPIMMFSLISGALADSFDRRRIMISAQILMLTASVLLTVLHGPAGSLRGCCSSSPS